MPNDNLRQIIFEDAAEKNLETIQNSSKIYSLILRELKNLPKKQNVFKTFFKRIDGNFSWFWLSDILDIPENKNIKIIFEEKSRSIYSFGQGLAKPDDNRANHYLIIFVFNAPQEYLKTTNSFNQWFIQNIDKLFLDYREIFIHEYTHIQDFKKLKNTFYNIYKKVTEKRANYDDLVLEIKNLTKKLDRFPDDTNLQTQLNLLKTNVLKVYKVWNAEYVNNPIETNAYFNQYMSVIVKKIIKLNKIKGLSSVKEKFGNSPQEFADIFFDSIPGNKKNYFSGKVKRSFLKKSAMMYDLLINKLKGKYEQ